MSKNKSDETARVLISIPKELKEKFNKKYPYNFSQFVRNAMLKALNDKDFYSELFLYKKNN